MVETPRERQIREELALHEQAVEQNARQRWREAKCALSGHRWDTSDPTWECARCGALHQTGEQDSP